MVDIKSFINSYFLESMKSYPTAIQETLITIISEKLSELYEYTVRFPEIVSPDIYRMDIIKVIADQFLFSIREDADLQEQIAILNKILYVYNRRGSIDTIENMWKYYGGNLPKEVKVTIPSYNLFRYSVSPLSGTHSFQDNETNRTGVYEVKVINSTYPTTDLRKFLIDELVAAGNYVYITSNLHSDLSGEYAPFSFDIKTDLLREFQMLVRQDIKGVNLSRRGPFDINSYNSYYSGKANIFIDITNLVNIQKITYTYATYLNKGFDLITIDRLPVVSYLYNPRHKSYESIKELMAYCTPTEDILYIIRYLYNRQGSIVEDEYPGYFVLRYNLLGEEVRGHGSKY